MCDALTHACYNNVAYNTLCELFHATHCSGAGDTEEVLKFDGADPYLAEDKAFLSAVTSGDPSSILSGYGDAAKTYALSWAIRKASDSTVI